MFPVSTVYMVRIVTKVVRFAVFIEHQAIGTCFQCQRSIDAQGEGFADVRMFTSEYTNFWTIVHRLLTTHWNFKILQCNHFPLIFANKQTSNYREEAGTRQMLDFLDFDVICYVWSMEGSIWAFIQMLLQPFWMCLVSRLWRHQRYGPSAFLYWADITSI